MKNSKNYLLILVIISVPIIIAVLILKPQTTPRDLPVHKSITGSKQFIQDAPTSLVDFVYAANQSAPAVVHIKSKLALPKQSMDIPYPFREFFDDDFWERFFGIPDHQDQPQQFTEASGSGVIIDPEGYIVTNNHVIDRALSIEIVLHDRRSYQGELVGKDPLTDLALLKIDEEQLSYLKFGDSDEAEIGEWVLAVGNPFYNLSSTVTAGIISAKARNINILRDQAAIESFIQTDAAVNRGNSGGALVNIQAELIGINTAIASPTGVYAGYAFAIPSNIVEKVAYDLKTYGVVKRAHLGVFIRNLDQDIVKKFGLEKFNGVLVDSLVPHGAAYSAGIKVGDIILEIDSKEIGDVAQLQALIGTLQPNDKVRVTLLRDNKELKLQVQLKELEQTSGIPASAGAVYIDRFGAEFGELSTTELKQLGIKGGAKLIKLHDGKLKDNTSIKEGFVILEIDGKQVRSVKDLVDISADLKGGVLIEGIYPGTEGRFYYAIGI